jgi:hypothetical protein
MIETYKESVGQSWTTRFKKEKQRYTGNVFQEKERKGTSIKDEEGM